MNRGVLQSSPVQQMMATGNNPSWWNMNNLMTRPPILAHHLGLGHNHNYDHDHDHDQYHQQLLLSSPSTTTSLLNCNSCSSNNNDNENNNISITTTINNNTNSLFQVHPYLNVNMSSTTPSSSSWPNDHIDLHNHHPSHLSESWSQYLMSGVCMGEEQEQDQVPKTKMERWEDQVVNNQHTHHITNHHQVKHEASASATNMVGYGNSTVAIANHDQKFQIGALKSSNNSHNTNNNWPSPSQIMKSNNNNNTNNNVTTSSPQSCVSTFSGSNCNSLLDFSSSKSSNESLHANHLAHDRSSECNSTANGGTHKKAKVQQSSTQSTFKVRKEKLGDRITALHQLVSPFGKTDTASVLLEAIGYIRFLQSQIEALSLPYLTSGAANKRQPHLVQGERNCMFPEDPGQLLNDHCLKRKGGPQQETYEETKDLKSRGLCLVPVSCTLHVGSDNGADYWAPAAFGGGYR